MPSLLHSLLLRSVATSVLQQSVLSSALFNKVINEGTECTFSKFNGNKNLRGVTGRPEGCAAIQ